VPVVVSDVPHGPRFIADGLEATVFVEPGSADALAAGLRTALARAPLSLAARAAARERAANFSVGSVAARFEKVLKAALARQPVADAVPPFPWYQDER
jgi:glycosyltransferase involved in cell wall biosynthesis